MKPTHCDHNLPLAEDCKECNDLADAKYHCLHKLVDCVECEELADDGLYEPTADCRACYGRRVSYVKPGEDCCERCYEDGGPHAGDDPFGRTDEDWERHAE